MISASIFIPNILPCFNFCLIAFVHGFQHDEHFNHSGVWQLIKIPGFNKIPKEITEKFINIAWTNCCVGTSVHVWYIQWEYMHKTISSTSSAYLSPLLDIGFANSTLQHDPRPLYTVFASHFAMIIAAPSPRALHAKLGNLLLSVL